MWVTAPDLKLCYLAPNRLTSTHGSRPTGPRLASWGERGHWAIITARVGRGHTRHGASDCGEKYCRACDFWYSESGLHQITMIYANRQPVGVGSNIRE